MNDEPQSVVLLCLHSPLTHTIVLGSLAQKVGALRYPASVMAMAWMDSPALDESNIIISILLDIVPRAQPHIDYVAR